MAIAILISLLAFQAASAASAKISNPQYRTADVLIVRMPGMNYAVPVTYTITNTGNSRSDFYMGYSTKPFDRNAPNTRTGWYDAPPIKVTLNRGESATRTLTTQLPYDAPGSLNTGYPSGLPYDITIAVWGGKNWDGTLNTQIDRKWNYKSFKVLG